MVFDVFNAEIKEKTLELVKVREFSNNFKLILFLFEPCTASRVINMKQPWPFLPAQLAKCDDTNTHPDTFLKEK